MENPFIQDMHAYDSYLNMYQHYVIKIVHHVILKISQPIAMHSAFRTCQHTVTFSYSS